MVHLARQGESLKARVCVPVSQPLSFSHYEHSAGEMLVQSRTMYSRMCVCVVCVKEKAYRYISPSLPSLFPSLSTYLQLSLENTSPVPLLLRNPTLTADITTTQLHTNFPQVYYLYRKSRELCSIIDYTCAVSYTVVCTCMIMSAGTGPRRKFLVYMADTTRYHVIVM